MLSKSARYRIELFFENKTKTFYQIAVFVPIIFKPNQTQKSI